MAKRVLIFFIHLFLISAVALTLAFGTWGLSLQWGFVTSLLLGFLFALLAVFFITNAMARYNRLSDEVNIELNKLRRIHHLARAFSRAENQVPWFDLVREAIESYLHAFEVLSFKKYDDTNELFRRITQQLYGFDKITSEKGKLLFQDLMTTSGQATEARQHIHALRDERIGLWGWGVLAVTGLSLVTVVLGAYGNSVIERLAAAAVVVVVLLFIDFAFMADTMRFINQKCFTKRYVDNIERMGFWPEEKH